MSYDNDQKLQEIIRTIKQGIETNNIEPLYSYNDELGIKVTTGSVGGVNNGIRNKYYNTYGIIVSRLKDNVIDDKCKEFQKYIKQKIKN